jgi:hypothetical protein
MEVKFNKYLNKDFSLNSGKLWADVSKIQGFYMDKRRRELYEAVTNWYNATYKGRLHGKEKRVKTQKAG